MTLALALLLTLLASATDVPPQEDDLHDVVRQIERGFAAGDPTAFDDRVDEFALAGRAFGDLDADETAVREAATGFAPMGSTIATWLEPVDASYRVLRVTDGPSPRALFRFASGDRLMYHEHLFERRGDRLVIVDLGYPQLDATLSELAHPRIAAIHASQNRGLLDRLVGRDDPWTLHASEIDEIAAIQLSEPRRALAMVEALPESVRRAPMVVNMQLHASQAIGDDVEVLVNALEALRAARPDAPDIELLRHDIEAARGHTDAALDALDRFDAIFDDPYIDLLRAATLGAAGRVDDARAAVARATSRDADLAVLAALVEIDVVLLAGDHARTLEILVTLLDDHGLILEPLLGPRGVRRLRPLPAARRVERARRRVHRRRVNPRRDGSRTRIRT